MKFLNGLGKVQRILGSIGTVLLGILFIVFSCMALAQPKKDTLTSTTGVIQHIEEPMVVGIGDDEDSWEYQVFVSYTDEAGVKHENIEYPSYDSSMNEGDEVEVLYDPASPENIQAPGGGFVPYITLAVGVIAVLIGAVVFLKSLKR